MANIFSFDYFGSVISAKALGTEMIPPHGQVISAHCIPFTADGKIVAVHVVARGIDIPGGHLDGDESPVAAMRREALEEANITVANPTLIDVWHLESDNPKLGLSDKPYLLLYVANVESLADFTPNSEVDERCIVTADDFIAHYFGDSRQARVMIDKALAVRQ